jgi:hypothetical protein
MRAPGHPDRRVAIGNDLVLIAALGIDGEGHRRAAPCRSMVKEKRGRFHDKSSRRFNFQSSIGSCRLLEGPASSGQEV